MKKLVILLCCLVVFSINAISLSGEQELACEMALCHPAGFIAPGCGAAAKKWHSLVKKGKDPWSYMRKCPTGFDDDVNENVIPPEPPCPTDQPCPSGNTSNVACTAAALNQRIKIDGNIVTIPSEHPKSCANVTNKPRYICSGEDYQKEEWELGYKKERVTKGEYEAWIKSGNAGDVTEQNPCESGTRKEPCSIYWKHIPIQKICWVDTGDTPTPPTPPTPPEEEDPFDVWGLASKGIGTLSSLINKDSSDDGGDDDGGGKNGNTSSGGTTGTSGGSGSSGSSGSSSGSGGGFSGILSTGGGGSAAGGEEGLGEDGEDDDEEDEEYGGNVSQDGYKIMSDLENYGDYAAIVRQVIEGKSRQEE
jgi:hypothetical protein